MSILFFVLFGVFLLGGAAMGIEKNPKADLGYSYSLRRTIPLVLLSFLFLAFGLSFTQVDAGSIGVVKYFGQPAKELYLGAHLILPIAESVTPIAVQTRIIQPNETASSKDLQFVQTQVTLAYHVDPI